MELHESEKPGKRRKVRWVLLSILALLIVAGVIVFNWQKNNIEAVKQLSQYSQPELEEQILVNDQMVQDILNAALETAKRIDSEAAGSAPIEPSAPSVSQPEAPAVGSTAPQTPAPSVSADPEVPKQPESNAPVAPPVESTVPATSVPPAESAAPEANVQPSAGQTPTTSAPAESGQTDGAAAQETQPAPSEPVQTGPTYEAQLQAIVDKVYALRAEYLKALDDLQAAAEKDYKAIPKANRTKKALISFVSTYITKATQLEKDCDSKMDAVVKELTELQKKYQQSMELVDAVKYTYANEKSLKKAWYMSELERRGLR